MAVDFAGLEHLIPSGATLTKVATGAVWSEGPLWMPKRNCLRWSDIPSNRILEYFPETRETRTYMTEVEFTNGRTLDVDGSVVQCSHGLRRVERDIDGVVTNLVDSYQGAHLNSPNDVIVDSDGIIWFTDPPYGIRVQEEGHPGVMEYNDCFVFRFDPKTKELHPAITDVEEPNGLAFSPDEKTLYVADTSCLLRTDGSGNHHIRAYDVSDGLCKNGRTFAVIDEGVSDGFRVDLHGNIWTSSYIGVQVFDPSGKRLGVIPLPEKVANLCFGGPNGDDLYIAATTSIYMIKTLTRDAARALK